MLGKRIMNKSDIIESIAYVGIPSEAILIEHSDPTQGLTVTSFGLGNVGGLKIVAARMFADQLTEETADLPDAPSADLFELLHKAILNFHQTQLNNCLFEDIETEIVSDHQKIVAKLRQIAGKLGIAYKEPEGRLVG